jgi:hypothetical protein
MSRKLSLVALFVVLAIAADHLRASLQHRLVESDGAHIVTGAARPVWLPSVLVGTFWIYAAVFSLLGFVVASLLAPSRRAVLWAMAAGLAVPISSLFFQAPEPWFMQDHGNTWLNTALGWVHWYMPPLAAGLGARLSSFRVSRQKRTHVA